MGPKKQIALRRVRTLFEFAKEVIHEDPDLAQRYVDMARKVAMATRVRIPPEYRQLVCKHCKSFILPGVNCRVRFQTRREPHMVVTCFNCGKHIRRPLKGRKE